MKTEHGKIWMDAHSYEPEQPVLRFRICDCFCYLYQNGHATVNGKMYFDASVKEIMDYILTSKNSEQTD